MAVIVSQSGSMDLSVDTSPSRAGTPILEMQNLIPDNVVKVTANFFARTNQAGRTNGFYYQISAVDAYEIESLTPASGVFQGSDGWQSCTLVGIFRLMQVYDSPTEDVDFELLFSKGDLSGTGQLLNITLIGEVISTTEP